MIKSVLLNDDGSGELWYGDGLAFIFDTYHKDVVALLGQTVVEKGGKLEFAGRTLGRVNGNQVTWVCHKWFVERVALGIGGARE